MPARPAARHAKPLVLESAFLTSVDDFLDIAANERDDLNASGFHGRPDGRRYRAANNHVRADLLQSLGDGLRRCLGKPDFFSCRHLPVDDIDQEKGLGKVESCCDVSLPGGNRCSAHPMGIGA